MSRIAAAAVFTVLIACTSPHVSLPVFGTVPDFTLTDQTGQPYGSAQLKHSVWVADFIFTNCPGPCPRMTSQMHQVQEATYKLPEVKLVSFTVDPERDTPEVLAGYARRHHASSEHWRFLTGAQPELHNLARNVFKLNNVDGTLQHSTRFALVDQHMQIRGYYDTSEAGSITQLVQAIHAVLREKS